MWCDKFYPQDFSYIYMIDYDEILDYISQIIQRN